MISASSRREPCLLCAASADVFSDTQIVADHRPGVDTDAWMENRPGPDPSSRTDTDMRPDRGIQPERCRRVHAGGWVDARGAPAIGLEQLESHGKSEIGIIHTENRASRPRHISAQNHRSGSGRLQLLEISRIG